MNFEFKANDQTCQMAFPDFFLVLTVIDVLNLLINFFLFFYFPLKYFNFLISRNFVIQRMIFIMIYVSKANIFIDYTDNTLFPPNVEGFQPVYFQT